MSLSIEIQKKPKVIEEIKLEKSGEVFDLEKVQEIKDAVQEHLLFIGLDRGNNIRNISLLGIGTSNEISITIIENGTTYYLTNPVWSVSQVEKIEGQNVPIAYNGEMQYEAIKERTIIKSYIASVNYKGTLEKEEIESVSFEITYKEVPQEEESTNYIPAVATAGAGIVVVSGIILWRRKKKNKIS